jgi:4-amino-4-deoxy-L-arabinose transferase-like glycosyltransferase
MVDGHGYTPPPGSPSVANFAPLYPLVLAGIGALGPDPLTVARVFNPLVFGGTVLVVGLLVRRLTGSVPLSLAAQLLVLSGTDFLVYHSAALSEPLFLLLTLLALTALAAALRDRSPGPLLAAAVLTGAACLTRYVGLALVAAGAVALVLLADGGRRWKAAVGFSAIALAPLVGWLAWVDGVAGRATNRRAVLHLPGASYATRGLQSASTWFVPSDVPWPVRAVVAAAAVAALVVLARRLHRDGGAAVAGMVGLFALAYLAALVLDRSLFDVTGRLDARFVLPLHAAAVAIGLWVLRGVDLRRSHLVRLVLSAVVGMQVVGGVFWASEAATDAAIRPGGFAAPAWNDSEVLDEVRALPPSLPVYTNQVDAVFFHTGRVASPVPEKAALLTGEINPSYGAQLLAMADGLSRGGLLVYFTHAPARRVFLPTPAELAGQLRLQLVSTDRVGVAYRSDRSSTVPAAGGP